MFLLVAFTSESFSDIDVKIISWRCLDADAAAIVMNIRGSVSHTWVGTWDKDNKRQWLWKLPCLDGFFGLNCRRPICLWDADWGTRVLVCFKHPFFPCDDPLDHFYVSFDDPIVRILHLHTLSCLPDRSDWHRWSQECASRWGCRGEDLQSEGGHRRPGKLVDEALALNFRVAWIDPDSELVRSQGSNWKKAYVPH